jgi:hypothetical protein
MEIRQARAEELPMLQAKLAESEGEQIDLMTARVWVAVEGGEIVGMLPARMCWQLEPMLLWKGNKITRSRAGVGMYRAAERWLGDRTENRTGIYWFFAVTRSKAVKAWASRLGWFRQYKGAWTFLKYL